MLALAGCGGSGGSTATSGTGAAPALTGTQWVLDRASLGISGAQQVSSWLRLEQGRAAGDDGCNTFTGAYTTSGSALRFFALAGTRKACPGAADAVAARVGPALERTRGYTLAKDSLTLTDGSGATLLRYHASVPHVQGRWEVISVLYRDAIHSVIIGTTLTANFAAGGKVSGSGGCNDFSGDYATHGTALTIGPLVSTQKACAGPDGADEQEQGYFAALASVRTFDQVGDALTLFDAQGRMAVTLTLSR